MIGIRQQAAHVASGPTIYAQDSFNRADSATSLGTADVGGAWTNLANVLGIASNRAYTPSDVDGARAGVAVTATDVIVTATVAVIGSFLGVLARAASGTQTYYLAQADTSGNVFLYKCVSGSFTQLGSTATAALSTGQTIGISCKGTAIKALVNGSAVVSVTDSAISTSAYCGLRNGSGGATKRWDDFLVIAS